MAKRIKFQLMLQKFSLLILLLVMHPEHISE